MEPLSHDSTTVAEWRSTCGLLDWQIEIASEMAVSKTTAGNNISGAMSWSLVLLACVICNLGFASTAEGATVRDEFDAIAYAGNNDNKYLSRDANMTGAVTATFTYNYSTDQGDRGFVHVEESAIFAAVDGAILFSVKMP